MVWKTSLSSYLTASEDGTVFRKLPYKFQTPGNHAEESVQEHNILTQLHLWLQLLIAFSIEPFVMHVKYHVNAAQATGIVLQSDLVFVGLS